MSKNLKQLQNRMYIFCEGEKTEPFYLSSYLNEHAPQKTKLISIPKTRKNTPIQLVDEAIKQKQSNHSIEGDIFWVVYDREAESEQPREKHKLAWDKAKRHGINVAISNVCFEFWILLHFEYTTQPYTSYKNLMSESQLKTYLKKLSITNYDKGSDELYFKISPGIGKARQRAKKVNQLSKEIAQRKDSQEFDYSPYTSIPDLLDAIDKF